MSLAPGTRFGPYEVAARLGAGGMGEVYRATDTNLGRQVAIKVLPSAVANDPDRLTRFDREARTLAALNHPNIAQVYGLEKAGGVTALVMELVEGPTLADLVAREPIPLGEALPIAKQITEALEAAHEQGIVHRDLKPANVKVREDGTVKLLDFGLAKAMAPAAASGDVANFSTITSPAMTHAGSVLGTAAYMSPEQARGKVVDKRADIWAFGCVLYEMLTGRPAFPGETFSDIVTNVLSGEPDLAALPAGTPTAVRRLIDRCLQKDVRFRLRDIGDSRFDLSSDDAPAERLGDLPSRRPRWQTVAAAVTLLVGGFVLRGILWNPGRQSAPPTPQPLRFSLPSPSGAPSVVPNGRSLAMSSDGRYVAFQGVHSGQSWLYLRDLSTGETRTISEASDGYPFFSPDSVWLAFFERGKLEKVSVRGGAPIPLADAPAPRGGSWGSDDAIVFAPDSRAGLSQVAAGGGPVRPLTTLDVAQAETSHRGPEVLPGGRAIVYRAEGTTYATGALAVFSRDTGRQHVLVAEGGFQPSYSPTGHLLYLQGDSLMAVPFDPVRLEISGTPGVVVEDVQTFAVSSTGTLVYVPAAGPRQVTLAWVDRRGRAEALPLTSRNMSFPRLTADDRRVAVAIQERSLRDIWAYDLERGVLSRLTTDGSSLWPAWTPDGRRILYGSNRPGTVWDVFSKASDGGGPDMPLVVQPDTQVPRDVSPDGRWMAYQNSGSGAGEEIWLFPLQGQGAAVPFTRARAAERWPAFSPDSRWLAYASNESGRDEIYVRAVDGENGKWQISNGGGGEPRWNPAGGELFYRDGGKMLAVDVTTGATFSAGTPRVLFDDTSYRLGNVGTNYDVAHDGTRFLMLREDSEAPSRPLNVVTNWFEELKRLVPTK